MPDNMVIIKPKAKSCVIIGEPVNIAAIRESNRMARVMRITKIPFISVPSSLIWANFFNIFFKPYTSESIIYIKKFKVNKQALAQFNNLDAKVFLIYPEDKVIIMNERKPILEKGYRLTLPIPLFLCVLRALKQKDGLDSIPLISFEEIITKIFGKRYIFYNWEVGRQYLLLNKEIEIFSSCVKQDNSYQLIKLIKITEEGLFLIENGEPDKDYESEIEKVVNWVKLNLKP